MNETILTWLVFILAFGGMVIIHEFGHFIVARLCKIEVEEFGIGLPTPGALTLFTWQGTRFTLNWLPLGGFVRPKGENDPNVPGGLAAASPWARLAVLFAGPLMNLLTAVIIYSIIFTRVGVPDTNRVLVSSVVAEGPAAQAGFQADDIFVSGNSQPIRSYDDLRAIVDENDGKPVVFIVDRHGEQIELTATPLLNETEKRVMIGVGLGVPFKAATSWVETLNLGARYTYINIRTLISLPAQMIRGSLAPEQGRLIGLKGIYDIFSQTVNRDVATTTAPVVHRSAGSARAHIGVDCLPVHQSGNIQLIPLPRLGWWSHHLYTPRAYLPSTRVAQGGESCPRFGHGFPAGLHGLRQCDGFRQPDFGHHSII